VGAYQSAIDELIGITDARLSRLTRKAAPAQAREAGRDQGVIMTDAQGNQARVFEDGTFEEIQ